MTGHVQSGGDQVYNVLELQTVLKRTCCSLYISTAKQKKKSLSYVAVEIIYEKQKGCDLPYNLIMKAVDW